MTSGADSGPNILLDWHESVDARRYWRAAIGTLVVHAGIIALVFFLGSLNGPAVKGGTEIVPDFRQAVHLFLPQDLTQKAPNKGKVAKEVNVEDLQPRPESQERLPPAPAVRAFRPPNPRPPGPQQSTVTPRLAEPPKIDTPLTAQNTAPALPALSGTPKAPPTQIQPVEASTRAKASSLRRRRVSRTRFVSLRAGVVDRATLWWVTRNSLRTYPARACPARRSNWAAAWS